MKINGSTARSVTYTPFALPSLITTPISTNSAKTSANLDTVYIGGRYERRTYKATCKLDDVVY